MINKINLLRQIIVYFTISINIIITHAFEICNIAICGLIISNFKIGIDDSLIFKLLAIVDINEIIIN